MLLKQQVAERLERLLFDVASPGQMLLMVMAITSQ